MRHQTYAIFIVFSTFPRMILCKQMKRIIFLSTALSLLSCCYFSCQPTAPADKVTTAEAADSLGYDAELAAQLGADQYGMKTFIMAYLKRGPNRSQDSTEAARLQAAHMANINRMAEEGKLVLAGPFLDDDSVRGIYVFDVATIEEARALTATDPAIQAGRLSMELRPWYGTAALVQLNEVAKRIAKENP